MKNYLPYLVLAFFAILYLVYTQKNSQKLTTPSYIKSFEINSHHLNRNVKIWVYLPLDYLQATEKLPVLYMHDGQNLFDEKLSFAGEWQVDESLDKLFKEKGKQIMVVGIENGGEKRTEELTPFPNPKYGGGKADDYLNFIIEELMPKIERDFNASHQRKDIGMMGSSLGGLITYYAAYKHSDKFSKFGVYSPSFWFNNKIFELTKNSKLPSDTRMLMMIGEKEQDEHMNVIKMENLLKQHQNIELRTEIYPLGEHNESFWSGEFKDDVEWLFLP